MRWGICWWRCQCMLLIGFSLLHCRIPPRSWRDLCCRWATKSLPPWPSHRTSLGWAQGYLPCMCAPIASYSLLHCLLWLWTVTGILPSVLTSWCESIDKRSYPLRMQVEKLSMLNWKAWLPWLQKEQSKEKFTNVIVAKILCSQLNFVCRMD